MSSGIATQPNDRSLSEGLSDSLFMRREGWFTRRVGSLVGIDIGFREVRMAVLRERQGQVAWSDRIRFSLPEPPEGEWTTAWLDSVIDVMSDRLPRCIGGEANVAAVALPVGWTHYQTVGGEDLAATQERLDAMFSQSIFQSSAHLSHWPVVGVHHGQPCSEDQYVVAAVADETACRVADRIAAVGYEIHSMLPHGVALVHGAQTLTGVDAQCVIWLGESSGLIAVRHRSGVGLARTLPTVRERIHTVRHEDLGIDAHTLRPYLSEISREFQATARYAAQADMGAMSANPILIAGPLAEVAGVDEVLATSTGLPVAVWRFRGAGRPTPPSHQRGVSIEDDRRRDARFATALSLALAAGRGNSRGYVQ